jgi:hypothetical protein
MQDIQFCIARDVEVIGKRAVHSGGSGSAEHGTGTRQDSLIIDAA